MDTNWLMDFLVLSKTGSFSQAAEERCITQSAFSRRIKALETWLGADLVDRSSYPVKLTTEGRGFHETAQNILRELQLNRVEFQRRSVGRSPDVRFVATTTLALSLVPDWLKAIRARCGHFSVSIDTYDFYEMIEMLEDRKMDMVLLYYHPQMTAFLEPHQFDFLKLGTDVMHLCTAVDDKGRPAFDVDNPPRSGLDYVGYGQTGYFSKIENYIFSRMSEQDPVFHSSSQSGTCEFMKRLAIMEQKMVWLPGCSAYDGVKAGELALAGDGRYDTELEIRIYKNRDGVSPLVQRIWNLLQEDPCTAHLEQFQLG